MNEEEYQKIEDLRKELNTWSKEAIINVITDNLCSDYAVDNIAWAFGIQFFKED